MADPEQPPFPIDNPENETLMTRLSRGEIFLMSLVCVAFVVLVAIATLRSDYSLATRLWLLIGVLVSAGFVAAAVNYAITSRRSFDEAYERYLVVRRRLSEAYAQSLASHPGDPNANAQAVEIFAKAASLAEDPDGDRQVISSTIIMNVVVFLVTGLIIVSFCTADDRCSWSSSMIWSIACVLLGGLTGFLFGIPRFRSEGKTPQTSQTPSTGAAPGAGGAQASTGRAVATNDQSPIEQIADWLTKTIVGVALVNLKALPAQLHRWAFVVSRSIDANGKTFNDWSAAGLITYFTIFGFLSGYLITQFFLQRYVNQHT